MENQAMEITQTDSINQTLKRLENMQKRPILLTEKAFLDGMEILSASQPSVKITPEKLLIWQTMLRDLRDEHYLRAIFNLLESQKEIYSTTNIPALIRELALQTQKAEDLEREKWEMLPAEAKKNILSGAIPIR